MKVINKYKLISAGLYNKKIKHYNLSNYDWYTGMLSQLVLQSFENRHML